jgi:hypothetical protein
MSERPRLRVVVGTEEEGVASEEAGGSSPKSSSVATLRTEASNGGRRCKVISGLRPAARKDAVLTGRTL